MANQREHRLIQDLAACGEAVLHAKEKTDLELEVARESAKTAAGAVQADHHATIEEPRQVLSAKFYKVSKFELDYDWIRSDGKRLKEDLWRAQVHEQELAQRLNQHVQALADIRQQVSQILKPRYFQRHDILQSLLI